MAIHLGRPLKSWEHVHHIDEDKANNDLSNLKLLHSSDHAEFTALQTENNRLRIEIERLQQLVAQMQSEQAA